MVDADTDMIQTLLTEVRNLQYAMAQVREVNDALRASHAEAIRAKQIADGTAAKK